MREGPWEASVPWEEVTHGGAIPGREVPVRRESQGGGSPTSGVILASWMVNGLTFFGEESVFTDVSFLERGRGSDYSMSKTRTDPPKPKPPNLQPQKLSKRNPKT